MESRLPPHTLRTQAERCLSEVRPGRVKHLGNRRCSPTLHRNLHDMLCKPVACVWKKMGLPTPRPANCMSWSKLQPSNSASVANTKPRPLLTNLSWPSSTSSNDNNTIDHTRMHMDPKYVADAPVSTNRCKTHSVLSGV